MVTGLFIWSSKKGLVHRFSRPVGSWLSFRARASSLAFDDRRVFFSCTFVGFTLRGGRFFGRTASHASGGGMGGERGRSGKGGC